MNAAVILSDFADDPQMHEILEEFCGRLPDTVCRLQQAFELKDITAVQRIAHQMKGAGGGYGFTTLSEIGAQLEAEARMGMWTPALFELADRFIQLCLAARPSVSACAI